MRELVRALRRAGGRAAAGALEALVRRAAAAAPAVGAPPPMPGSIFVLRNNDVGDVLVVTPLFEALRHRYPTARIAAGVGDWSRDVLRGNPHLDEVLTVNAPWFNKYLARQGPLSCLRYLQASPEVDVLARQRFEIGIDVLGSAWGSLLLLRAGIPYRLGVRGYAGGESGAQVTIDFDPEEHVGRSALRFAELLGLADLPPCRPQLFVTPEEREAAERCWALGEVAGDRRPRLVIGPGGGLATKRWPEASWAALLRGLSAVGDVDILITGGPAERELVTGLAASSPAARTLAEPPGLRSSFALVAAADLVICSSSMLMHVAAAFGKPTLVLLGESFASATQHQRQWGYPGLSESLGKEPGIRAELATPQEALATAQRMAAACSIRPSVTSR